MDNDYFVELMGYRKANHGAGFKRARRERKAIARAEKRRDRQISIDFEIE